MYPNLELAMFKRKITGREMARKLGIGESAASTILSYEKSKKLLIFFRKRRGASSLPARTSRERRCKECKGHLRTTFL